MPTIIHTGEISEHLEEHYGQKLTFMMNETGHFDKDALGGCILNIFQYVILFLYLSNIDGVVNEDANVFTTGLWNGI